MDNLGQKIGIDFQISHKVKGNKIYKKYQKKSVKIIFFLKIVIFHSNIFLKLKYGK